MILAKAVALLGLVAAFLAGPARLTSRLLF